jgi:hypothetical protein
VRRATGVALRRPCDLKPRAFKLKHRLVLSLSLSLATGPAQATPPPTQICVTSADAGRPACAWLFRARAELAAGRAPEAAAAARRAESAAAGPDAQALVDAAQLLRADALARGRRLREAAAIVATLLQSGSTDVRAAAALRWADLQRARTRARALDGLAAESRTPEGCRRVMRLARGRLPELARGAQRPEALLALASCSETPGLEAYAARLRGAALASPGAAAASASADATPPLADGPARAADAYAAGDFMALRAMPEAMAWRILAQAAETADRARAALAP